MRYFILACLFLLVPHGERRALAQGPRPAAQDGWGEEIVFVDDLPPDVRADLRQVTKRDLAIGFYYRHWFLFGDGFDLWTWDGKYVLFAERQYYEISHEELAALVGKDRFTEFGKPLAYRIPAGLATVLGFGTVLMIGAYLSVQARAQRLLRDPRYRQALEVCNRCFSPDSEPTREEIEQAIDVGAEFLQQTYGIPARQAAPRLRALMQEQDRARSYDLRHEAIAHEQAGEWEQAIAFFEQAARAQKKWDEADFQFLQRCIQRVRTQRARAEGA